MKKSLLFLVLLFAVAQTTRAWEPVRERRFGIDFQVAEHVGLNAWSRFKVGTLGLPAASVTEFRFMMRLYFIRSRFGMFYNMGFGILPSAPMRGFDASRMPMPMGSIYHLRDSRLIGPKRASANFVCAWGLFGNIPVTDKMSLMPYIGIGAMSIPNRSYEVVLKEEGTNMQYYASYTWGKHRYDWNRSSMLGYLTARLNFRYKITPRQSLLAGLEYTHFYETMNFYTHSVNSYNPNIGGMGMFEGRRMNMLAISVGISFM